MDSILVTVNDSTPILQVSISERGIKGDSGEVALSASLDTLTAFTGSIQNQVNDLTAVTGSYITSLPDGLVSSSLQVSYTAISDVPVGIVSSSNQVSSSFVNLSGDVMTGTLLTPNISSSYVDLTVNGIPAYKEGRMFYDTVTGAFNVYNDQPDVTLQLGQEIYIKVINKSGVDILNGVPVFISGSQGDTAKIWPAFANVVIEELHINHIIGLSTHDILDNETGYVTTLGLVGGLDTSQWIGGTELFLSSSVGEFTDNPEDYPYEKTFVGFVARQHATVGTIYVKTKEPIHFDDISGLANGTAETNDLWVKDADGAFRARHDNLVLSGSFNGSITLQNIPVPTSTSGSGTQNELRLDSDYIYVCTAPNTWKRVALSSWP